MTLGETDGAGTGGGRFRIAEASTAKVEIRTATAGAEQFAQSFRDRQLHRESLSHELGDPFGLVVIRPKYEATVEQLHDEV